MQEKKEKTPQFEWWEEEEYSPGIARLPIGNYQYKKVRHGELTLKNAKWNIHVHLHVLQEKQPDVIVVNDSDSNDKGDKGPGKKTTVRSIFYFFSDNFKLYNTCQSVGKKFIYLYYFHY